LTHCEDQVDQLLGIHALGQLGPGVVADACIGVQLVGRSKQRSVEGIPAFCVRPCGDSQDLVVKEPRLLSDHHVLSPLVLGAAQPADAQDHQLALSGR